MERCQDDGSSLDTSSTLSSTDPGPIQPSNDGPTNESTPDKQSKSRRKFGGEHDDECYICDEGGELVCCDFCSKAYHGSCHKPAFKGIPTGDWECCECYAGRQHRLSRCGECDACLRDDCGKCVYCKDRTKFGGPNILKQVCVHRKCQNTSYARTAVPGKIPGEISH